MIATITDVILARSDSAAQSRKYWKKHGKKINTRKRLRRKAGAVKTAYIAGDYKWVMNTINQYQKNGISLIGLWKSSSEKERRGPRSELPPGRDKISQIVADGDNIDWKVSKSAGGRGNRTVILPLQPDEIHVIERLGKGIEYRTMVERLKSFQKKGNMYTNERFKRNDFFLYAALKDEIFSFPMKIFKETPQAGRSGSDKSAVFNAIVSDIQKNHLKTMRKIEDDQKSLNKKFPKILEYVGDLRESNVEELIFKVSNRDIPKNIVPTANALRRLFG